MDSVLELHYQRKGSFLTDPCKQVASHVMCSADVHWQQLCPTLLDSVLAWIDPQGQHGWTQGLLEGLEPLCAALNLCRFLLLRECGQQSNLTGVRLRLTTAVPQLGLYSDRLHHG